jgi:hypothetical protein
VVVVTLGLLVATAGAAGSAAAQTGDGDPPVVLSVPLSVRSAGLQGAGAALVGHAGAVFSNPAGLATIRHIGLEGSIRRFSTDATLSAAAFAWRLRQFDLGVGLGYVNFGTDPATFPPPGAPLGSDAYEVAGVGSLVYRFGIIALGGSAKYVQRTLDTREDEAVSADAGLAIAIFDILAIAFSVQNIGDNWKDESALSMPRLSRFGFTMNYVDPLESFRLLSTLEVQWLEDIGSRFVLGTEAGIVVKGVGVLGRVAFGGRSEELAGSQFTFGGSVAISRLAIDYAFQDRDPLAETVHRFGLRLAL